MSFASEKARAQVERILRYLACPGMACVLDPDGLVLAAVAAAANCDARMIADVFGRRENAWIGDRGDALAAELGPQHAVLTRSLYAERSLVLVVPCAIASSALPRMERAQALLERMLAPSSGGGSPAPAHAALYAQPGFAPKWIAPPGRK